eukprot:TRINITY_DN12782_c0_g1_i1.p1 TRINITY_DN12782_c0_g1~~TRINITY_DN12782_c0_g1_i1.p1  ORF type:complete len:413 (+),score=101.78 TRINITY_DN12782_c0_g1_i1:107-1345(+)
MASAMSVSASVGHSFVRRADGSVWVCGRGEFGELGDRLDQERFGGEAHEADQLSFRPVGFLHGARAVQAGNGHSLVIKADKSLHAWGCNNDGRLGIGTEGEYRSLAHVLDNISCISVGDNHTAAVTEDGSLLAWGVNEDGQLGTGGPSETVAAPQKVALPRRATSCAVGNHHSVAVLEDGDLWAWGGNESGQLGDDGDEGQYEPIRVLRNVQMAAAGEVHTLAVTQDGSLWAWGCNQHGQLGDGTRRSSASPIQVNVEGDVIWAAADSRQSMAITDDGSLWVWGCNDDGQLGMVSATDVLDPVRLDLPGNVVAAACSYHHTLAVLADGSVFAWGSNEFGQLGLGSRDAQKAPVRCAFSDGSTEVTAEAARSDGEKGFDIVDGLDPGEDDRVAGGEDCEQATVDEYSAYDEVD